MSNRFTRADPRDDLFSSYNRSASPSKSKNKARASPYNAGGGGAGGAGYGYGYGYTPPPPASGAQEGGFGAYPGVNGNGGGGLFPGGSAGSGRGGGGYGDDFRSATPNSRGQYSAAVLDELESQNDEHVGVLTGKVKMLKDVCFSHSQIPLFLHFPLFPFSSGLLAIPLPVYLHTDNWL